MSTHICKTKKIKARTAKGKKTNRDQNIKNSIDYIKDHKQDVKIENIKHEAKLFSADKALEESLIDYATNENKCFDKQSSSMLISGINCDPNTASDEFIEAERAYHSVKKESCKNGAVPNEAFHIMLSFKGHTVPATKVHEIGKEFAERLAGCSFKALVTTHTNTENYHDHIVLSAYAIDGAYKFRDEWNLGKKLMRISDELALENGLEIILNTSPDIETEKDDEELVNLLEKTRPMAKNIRDLKMAKKNPTYKSTLMNDIILTCRESLNFQEFEEKMTKKGYELRKNDKSISYYKENGGIIRDNRLGYQYTEKYLKRYFNIKEDEKTNGKYKVTIDKKALKMPKYSYDELGNYKFSFLERIIIFIINILKEIIKSSENKYKKSDINARNNENIIKKRINTLNSALSIVKKHNIIDFYDNKVKFNNLLKEYTILNNFHKEHNYSQAKYRKICEANNTVEELKDYISNKIGLSDKDLKLLTYGDIEIMENLAKCDPINTKTRSRLYKAMHNADFRLLRPFSAITEHEAKEIVYFLSEYKKNNATTHKKPDFLISKKEYYRLKNSNKLPVYKKTNKVNNLSPLDLSMYTKDKKDLILRYKKAKSLLLSYGIKDSDDYEKLYEERINPVLNNMASLEERLAELKEKIHDFNRLNKCLSNDFSSIKGPIKLIDDEKLTDIFTEKVIKNSETEVEKLKSLKEILDTIDYNVLSDETIDIAPMNIITAIELINNIDGKEVNFEDIIKYSKDELKEVIEQFKEKHDIDKEIEEAINNEIDKANEESKDIEEDQENTKEICGINKKKEK